MGDSSRKLLKGDLANEMSVSTALLDPSRTVSLTEWDIDWMQLQ